MAKEAKSYFPLAYLSKEDSDSFVRVANTPADLPEGMSFIIIKTGVTAEEVILAERAITCFHTFLKETK